MPGILERRISEKASEEESRRKSGSSESTGRGRRRKDDFDEDDFDERDGGRNDENDFDEDESLDAYDERERRRKNVRKGSKEQRSTRRFMKGRELVEEKPDERDDSILTDEDVRELDMLEAMSSHDEYLRGEKRRKRTKRLATLLMAVACAYLTMLIYGVFTTEFRYGETGEVEPVELSVADIAAKNEYSTLMGAYVQARMLYERILILDYRMASGTEDLMAVAPEYEEVIDDVNKLAVQIDAMTVSSKYNQVASMLYTWVNMHAFNYCRYMSTAVTQNDAAAADEALAAREVLLETFQLITQNVITLGSEIKGYDLSDVKNWSPEGYVQETILGTTSEEQ